MTDKRKDNFDQVRAELIRLKVDARQITLHEWLERAYALIGKIESEAIARDRLTRVIGPGRIVETRGRD